MLWSGSISVILFSSNTKCINLTTLFVAHSTKHSIKVRDLSYLVSIWHVFNGSMLSATDRSCLRMGHTLIPRLYPHQAIEGPASRIPMDPNDPIKTISMVVNKYHLSIGDFLRYEDNSPIYSCQFWKDWQIFWLLWHRIIFQSIWAGAYPAEYWVFSTEIITVEWKHSFHYYNAAIF